MNEVTEKKKSHIEVEDQMYLKISIKTQKKIIKTMKLKTGQENADILSDMNDKIFSLTIKTSFENQ